LSTSPRPTLQLGDIILRFPWDPVSGRVGLEINPTALTDKLVPPRKTLRGLPYIDAMPGAQETPAYVIDSLAQVKIAVDSYPGAFAQGHTMQCSPSVDAFSFTNQTILCEKDEQVVRTELKNAQGHWATLEIAGFACDGKEARKIKNSVC
jgi:hypothetical protein